MASVVIGQDEDVLDLSDEPRAEEPWEVARSRRVEAGLGDHDVGESRSSEVLERLRVQVQLA